MEKNIFCKKNCGIDILLGYIHELWNIHALCDILRLDIHEGVDIGEPISIVYIRNKILNYLYYLILKFAQFSPSDVRTPQLN